MSGRPRVALVHDLLVSYGGSEQVLYELHRMYPDAPVFTTVFDPGRLPARFGELNVRTSFLQHMPFVGPDYQALVPFMPLAFENFDLRGYDLIISSSHACSKGVIPQPEALHVCYCYTPLRYAWSTREEYRERVPLRPLVHPLARPLPARPPRWDYIAAQRVDCFITLSQTVRRRIAKYYRRESDVVYPPVDLHRFQSTARRGDSHAPFLVVSRLQPYKRVEVAVKACTRLGLYLSVIGRRP